MNLQKIEIEEEIKEALDKMVRYIKKKGITGDGPWSEQIKLTLGKIGQKHKYKVCTGGMPDRFAGEWLYDMVWYEETGRKPATHRMTSLILAAECEWKMDLVDIKYDFEKLLVVNASHRLMICEVKAYDKQKKLDYFRDAIKSYKQGHSGDKFLIAIWDADKLTFEYFQLMRE